jgi:hypothetical protein
MVAFFGFIWFYFVFYQTACGNLVPLKQLSEQMVVD